ncbi:TROVE domain-containing protein [Planobispora siamensis]|uniref:RNA-binding protein n=1 Tax=Planobispora siamensis TaxID=936338 RepID=A0A8J3SM58_9ACTN|nr:TROVE domain-containing protein [Planobispora siamensis]GIH95397.1 RNA-binding protein [Planobispora siamensis]
MSKLNPSDRRSGPRPTPAGPLRVTAATPTTTTHEGAPAYAHDPKTALFLLATTSFWGEDSFYESADVRAERFRSLVRDQAVGDPAWLTAFIGYLRGTANIRSGAIVAAAEMAKTRQENGLPGHVRQAVSAALQRADEPGAIIHYYLTRYATPRHERRLRGLTLPIALRRGVVDAVVRLYTEKSALKWDRPDAAVRFGDVVDLVEPAHATHGNAHLRGTPTGDLFRWLIERRHNRDNPIPATLPILRARQRLMQVPVADRRSLLRAYGVNATKTLAEAGMTHEALAGWLEGPLGATEWAMILPTMGYMALLKNLANLDRADVPDDIAAKVAARLADPVQVARSRQLPFRFLSAYSAVSSDRWATALGAAFEASVGNIPHLTGRTLVLVDVSGSMRSRLSEHSTMTRMMVGALFGVVLAARGAKVDLHGFADATFHHDVPTGASVLKSTQRFLERNNGGIYGHGTQIAAAIRATYRGHDRVIVITDEQTSMRDHYYHGNVTDAVPRTVPLWCFNTSGETGAVVDAGTTNRYSMGGLSDTTFSLIPVLESGQAGRWPFDSAA